MPVIYVSNPQMMMMTTPPFDLIAGGRGGWSTRKLRSTYTGSCLRIRRSTPDTTEQDIGFTGNLLDTAALLSFCGSGNGFKHTWYSQGSVAADLLQVVQADQPQLVSSGTTIVTINGQPSPTYDGSGDCLIYGGFASNLLTVSAGTVVSVWRAASVYNNSATVWQNDPVWSQRASTCGLVLKNVPTVHAFNHDGSYDEFSSAIALNTNYLHTWKHEAGTVYGYLNSSTPTSVASGNTSSLLAGLAVGFVAGNSLNSFNGVCIELLIWDTALSATDLNNVQQNVAGYYGITLS